MGKEFRLKLEKLFDFLGELLAFIIAVVWVASLLNANFHFYDSVPVIVTIVEYVKEFALLALVIVVGLEATIKRNFIIRIVFYALAAILIIFHFFPGTYEWIIDKAEEVATSASIIALL